MNNKVEILSASIHVYIDGESVLVDQGGLHIMPSGGGKETHLEWPIALYLIKKGDESERKGLGEDWIGDNS